MMQKTSESWRWANKKTSEVFEDFGSFDA